MIAGIGTDIVNIARINDMLMGSVKDKLLLRILTEHERAIFNNRGAKSNYVAKRFAAKEAFAKALGTGIGQVVSFQDLTVRHQEEGKPYFQVSEKLRQYLLEQRIKVAHLSLSDEQNHAIAFVVLEYAND